MKKILIGFLFLAVLFSAISAFALEVTSDTDRDKFQYRSNYQFATTDLGASYTLAYVPTNPAQVANVVNQLVIRRAYDATYNSVAQKARIVGIAVSGNRACTLGSATFDVVINGTVTGVQSVIENFVRPLVGAYGASGSQYAYTLQDRDDDRAPLGFQSTVTTSNKYDGIHPYGRVTPLSAGDRIGVKVTTSSDFSPIITDYVVEVYVLE